MPASYIESGQALLSVASNRQKGLVPASAAQSAGADFHSIATLRCKRVTRRAGHTLADALRSIGPRRKAHALLREKRLRDSCRPRAAAACRCPFYRTPKADKRLAL